MPDFKHMKLSELVRHEGYACECGREHICALDYLNVGRGILGEVPAMLGAMGVSRPFAFFDAAVSQGAFAFRRIMDNHCDS